jgi:hypothetical protein
VALVNVARPGGPPSREGIKRIATAEARMQWHL